MTSITISCLNLTDGQVTQNEKESESVTEFDKTRLPHTSNFLTLTGCNLTTQQAIGLKFSQSPSIAL